MGVNTTGITPAANFIPEIWAPELSDASQGWTGLSSLVDRSYEGTGFDIVHIQDVSNPAVRVKSEDTAGSYANITETQQNITVNRQAYVGFIVEDIAEIQSKYDVRETYTNKANYSLMAHIEGDATSGLASLPSSFSQLVGALGVDPTTDNIIRAKQYLDDGDVPESERFFYMSPGTHASLLKQDVFLSADYGPTGAVATGNAPRNIFGAQTQVSTLASNSPSTSGQSYSWFCHKKGVALIMQRTPTPHLQWENLEISWGVVVDVIYQFAERLIAPKDLGGGTSDDRFNVGIRGP